MKCLLSGNRTNGPLCKIVRFGGRLKSGDRNPFFSGRCNWSVPRRLWTQPVRRLFGTGRRAVISAAVQRDAP